MAVRLPWLVLFVVGGVLWLGCSVALACSVVVGVDAQKAQHWPPVSQPPAAAAAALGTAAAG